MKDFVKVGKPNEALQTTLMPIRRIDSIYQYIAGDSEFEIRCDIEDTTWVLEQFETRTACDNAFEQIAESDAPYTIDIEKVEAEEKNFADRLRKAMVKVLSKAGDPIPIKELFETLQSQCSIGRYERDWFDECFIDEQIEKGTIKIHENGAEGCVLLTVQEAENRDTND